MDSFLADSNLIIRRLVLLTVIVLSMVSCTKFGKNVTVKGRVLNPVTGEGISGVEVRLQKISGGSVGSSGGFKTVKTATTDADGNFEISKASLSKLYIDCNTSLYDVGWHQNSEPLQSKYQTSVKKGKVMHLDYYSVPYGQLQINTVNVSCFDANDELKILRSHSINTLYDNVPNPAIYSGCINLTGNLEKAPMGWYKYVGTVTKNNVVTPIEDSVYLNEGETKTWNINY